MSAGPAADPLPRLPVPARADASGGAQGARRASVPRYEVEVLTDVEHFLARCEGLATPDTLPFHATSWLRAWYATLGQVDGRMPLPVAVRDRDSGRDLALLPLVVTRRRGWRVIGFADAGVCDYAAPILAGDWCGRADVAPAAAALWRALRRALRGCGDVLLIDKLLGERLDGPDRVNPLMLTLPVRESELFGNEFTAPQGWEAWRRSLDKTVRKEIERCWRVFHRDPAARFEQVTDLAAAQALLEVLERQQSERMGALGKPYVLDEPAYREFYRRALAGGLAGGGTVLTVLRVGEEVVSALFGVANGVRYIALRQSVAGAAWKQVSPGRLLDEQTAHHLHDAGLTHYDFGIGDYHHKAALKLARIPLYEACVALSWRGWPVLALWRLKRWLKQQPLARRLKQRLEAWRAPSRRRAVPS